MLWTLLLSLLLSPALAWPGLILTPPQTVPWREHETLWVHALGAEQVTWTVDAEGPAQEHPHLERYDRRLAILMPPAGTTLRIAAAAVRDRRIVVAQTSVVVQGSPARPTAPAPAAVASIRFVAGDVDRLSGSLVDRLATSRMLRGGLAERGVQLRDGIRDLAGPLEYPCEPPLAVLYGRDGIALRAVPLDTGRTAGENARLLLDALDQARR
jgi:hypothetical protein